MRFLSTCLSALLVSVSINAEEIGPLSGWIDRLPTALAEAQHRDLPLLIAFLGPNWCPHSDQLEQDILSQPALQDLIGDAFVFVQIDIPEDYEDGEYYGKDWKERCGIEGCPSIVLMTSEAEVMAKLDDIPMTCDHFANDVQQLRDDFRRMRYLPKRELRQMKVDEIKHLYARAGRLANATFKTLLMEQGLKVDRGPYFLIEKYGALLASGVASKRTLDRLRGRILARNPHNRQNCLRKLAFLEFETGKKGGQPERVIQPLVHYLSEFGPEDHEHAWRLEMQISQYLFSHHRVQKALEHAQLSYQAAPQGAKKEIAHSIQYLQSLVP